MLISKQPPRYKLGNSTYFLTFNVYDRLKILHNKDVAEFIIEELKFYSKKIKSLIAYTIMREHIHLLVEILNHEDLSDFLRDFKKFTSKGIKKRLNLIKPHIWLRGTMDHCIRTENEDDFMNHLGYIFYNSKKHLNILPKDFPYHNFLEFVEKGYFEIDYCNCEEKPFVQKLYD
ncbi:MAG: transposase [Candidatus Parcubacteria bacterium]|nr:transposase [Candidatus Parcubacteria bacterium]